MDVTLDDIRHSNFPSGLACALWADFLLASYHSTKLINLHAPVPYIVWSQEITKVTGTDSSEVVSLVIWQAAFVIYRNSISITST